MMKSLSALLLTLSLSANAVELNFNIFEIEDEPLFEDAYEEGSLFMWGEVVHKIPLTKHTTFDMFGEVRSVYGDTEETEYIDQVGVRWVFSF